MTFRISLHQQKFLHEKIASRGDRNEDDVIAHALSLLQHTDQARSDALLAVIEEGEAGLCERRFISLRNKAELDDDFAEL